MSFLFDFGGPKEPKIPPSIEPVAGKLPTIMGAEIAALTLGTRVAGDFYDSIRVAPQRILFGLLDVAGRSENNQAILAAAQKIFRSGGMELFSEEDVNESDAISALSLRLNRGIMEAAGGVHSCPAFLGCYHEQFGTLCYTNAGHTPGLLRDGTGISELASTGLPLGLFSHATADAPTAGMEKGAALLLVSRGVVEGQSKDRNAEDSEFGFERVKEFLQSEALSHAQEIAESILKTAQEFSSEPSVPEDMTALCLLRTK